MAEKEYIEREAVMNALFHEQYGYLCEDAINSIPAADVRPVVRGHIEEDENTYLFCSECKCDITLATYETPDNRLVLRPKFCPNCGADMRPQPPKEETE